MTEQDPHLEAVQSPATILTTSYGYLMETV